jgi:AmmeMemoRadiSam system protein A
MNSSDLTEDELRALVEVAERSVHLAVTEGRIWAPEVTRYPPALSVPRAAFVTLRKVGRLMGCIGTLSADSPLIVTVADRARAAALADPRFPGIRPDDLADLDVSVSVLSMLEPMPVRGYEELLATVRPGIDGLLIEAGYRGATLLPSVWDELREPGVFIAALWRKAQLAPRLWPEGIRVSRYTAQNATRVG